MENFSNSAAKLQEFKLRQAQIEAEEAKKTADKIREIKKTSSPGSTISDSFSYSGGDLFRTPIVSSYKSVHTDNTEFRTTDPLPAANTSPDMSVSTEPVNMSESAKKLAAFKSHVKETESVTAQKNADASISEISIGRPGNTAYNYIPENIASKIAEGKDSYMVEPEFPMKGERLEHTSCSNLIENITRKIEGTVTDKGTWIDCDIITDRSTDDGYLFNSRHEKEVIQPTERQGEEISKLQTTVNVENTGDDIVIRKTGISEDTMRELTEEQMKSSIPDVIGPSFLNAASPNMDGSIRCPADQDMSIPCHLVNPSVDIHDDHALGMSADGNGNTGNLPGVTEKESLTGSDVSTETKEAEKESARIIQESVHRKFSREGGKWWKDMCSFGQIVEDAVARNLTSEDDAATNAYQAGKRKLGGAIDFLSFFGAKSAYDAIMNKAAKVASYAKKAENAIVNSSLTLSDLDKKKDELLAAAINAGLSKSQAKHVFKNKEEIKQLLETKQILLTFATENSGKMPDNLVNFLKGKGSNNSQLFSKEFSSAARSYFASSKDPLFRKINPANMTEKKLKKLIKKTDKFDIKRNDLTVLKELLRNKKLGRIRSDISHAHGLKGNVRGISRVMGNLVQKLGDDAVTVGINQTRSVYNGTKTAYTMIRMGSKFGMRTVKFAGKVVFMNPLSRYLGKKAKQALVIMKNTAKTKIASATAAKEVKSAIEAIYQNKRVQKVKKTASKIKKTSVNAGKKTKKAANKVRSAGRKVKGATNKAGRIIKKPFDIIFAPFKLISRLVNKIKALVFKYIILPFAGVLVALALIYVILICISGAAMSLIDKSKKDVFLTGEDMQSLVTYLNEKVDGIFDDALDTAKGEPITDEVYNGTNLFCYGSPRYYGDPTSEYYHHDVTIDEALLNGWHVYYLNGAGDVICSTSNVKDIICLASVMMSNNSDDLGEYKNLVDDMWSGMAPYITTKESDIYHTEYSTDVFPKNGSIYYCNNGDFYKEYETAKKSGVCFYDSPVGQTTTTPQVSGYICSGTGCCYRSWYELELDCSIEEHTHSNSCYSTNKKGQRRLTCTKSGHTHNSSCYKKVWYREYYCPGHKALHCSYGYRDINVFVTLPSKDDVFKGTTDAKHTTFEYLIPYNYDGSSFETREVTMNYKTHLDGYRRRMDDFINNDFWDYSTHLTHSHFDTETRVVTCDLPSINSDGSVHKGASADQRCAGAIEWCNSLYLTDWYETYGITSIAGTGVKTSLTETEVENYMAVIDATYPSLSTSRRQMIVLALEQVGRIGFWYGGKPFNTGWNAEWGQVAPSSNPYYGYNTSYGRTILGLDAFGFAGWCYWSNYGIEPDFSSFGFVDSLNLVQTSSGNLLPGDVGLELIAGKTGNHIGIFAGYNDDGDMLWIHCNDITGNVAINSTNVFRYYYRIEK